MFKWERTVRRLHPAIVVLGLWLIGGGPARSEDGPRPLPSRGYTIRDLGTLGGDWSEATDINDQGQVVGQAQSRTDWVAFIYDSNGMRALNSGTDTMSAALAINGAGHVVGEVIQRDDAPFYVGFLYDGTGFHDLSSGDGSGITARGINDAGQIVGGAFVAGNWHHAFLYEHGEFLDLSPWVGARSSARGINNAGQVIGSSYDSLFQNTRAFLYDGTGSRDLGDLGGPSSLALAINSRGQIVGASSVGQSRWPMHAFLYDGTGIRDLGTLGGSDSYARDINDWGHVVGESFFDRSNSHHAFVYSDGVMHDLNQSIPAGSGWVLITAAAINNAGQIVGRGRRGDDERAFLLTPIADDTTPPTTTVSSFPAPDESGWHTGGVTITLTTADDPAGTGIESIAYRAEGAQPISSTVVNSTFATIRLSAEGETTLTCFGRDKAGNTEAERTLTLRIRKTDLAERAYTVRDLGTLGGASSRAYDINNQGEIVGFAEPVSGPYHAFLYRDGSMRDLGTLGGQASQAFGTNDRGEVVGWSQQAPGQNPIHAFLYSGGKMSDLGTLGGSHSYAQGINDSGQIVGWADLPSDRRHAFRYSDGRMVDLGTLGGESSDAFGINGAGQIVGESLIDPGQVHPDYPHPSTVHHAFLYSEGGMADLGIFGRTGERYPPVSTAFAINEAGVAVGEATVFRTEDRIVSHAAFFRSGRPHSIGTLGGTTSTAYGVNRAGQIVGSSSHDGSTRLHAFLYENGAMIDLNRVLPEASGWELAGARAINDKGQIVGWGYHDGAERAFLLTPGHPDETAPTLTVTPLPLPGASGWHRGAVSVRMSAVDEEGGSGVAGITYRAEGAQPIAETTAGASTSVSITAEGETTITGAARDAAGNASPSQSVTVRLDATAPATRATTAPLPGSGGSPGVRVTLAATDREGGSGVEAITYSALGAQPIAPTSSDGATVTLPITVEGRTTLTYAARDRAGNLEALKTLMVTVERDRTAPTTTATLSPPPNPAGLHTADVTLTLTAVDNENGMGVESITYSATGAQSIPRTTVSGADSTVRITITVEGATTIRFFARDNAGNSEPFKSITLRIDKRGAPGTTTGSLEPLVVTYDSLCAMVRQFATKASVADALCAKLEAARSAEQRKAPKAKAKAISAFVKLVKKRQGKYLPREKADLLVRLSGAL